MTALERAQQLQARFPDIVSGPTEFRGEYTLTLAAGERIAEVCACAKADFSFDYLVDISSVDHYGEDPRFQIVYHLCGFDHRHYVRLSLRISEEKVELPTVTGVWRTADWHEREIYDMMGIRFQGHPNLKRILMWEGYPYFPLRKEFPLGGKPSDVSEVAFTKPAPLEGGPFVTIAGGKDTMAREPRGRLPESDPAPSLARPEGRPDHG